MISVEQKLHSVCAHLLIGKAYLWPLALLKPSIQVKILSWFKRNFNGSGERWTKRSLIQCYRRCISEIMTHTRLGDWALSLCLFLEFSISLPGSKPDPSLYTMYTSIEDQHGELWDWRKLILHVGMYCYHLLCRKWMCLWSIFSILLCRLVRFVLNRKGIHKKTSTISCFCWWAVWILSK